MKVIPFFYNESQLIKKALRNNRKAQQMLYDRYAPKMLSVCRIYIKDLQQAEEAMCNGFLKMFKKLDGFRKEGSFEGWLRRIMVRESISYLRSYKKLEFSDTGEIFIQEAVDTIESNYEVAFIQELIDSLPEGYRAVFVLYAIEGYKHQEISQLLNISESTSKSQLHKARKKLKELLHQANKNEYGST